MIIKDIKIEDIVFGENIRQTAKDFELEDFMQTIKNVGLLQPIGVKEQSDKKYKILWGHRRLSACKKLGWKTIPSVIYSSKEESMTEQEFAIINGIENLHQSPNTLFEIGRVCKFLKKTMSLSEMSVKLGMPKSRIENAIGELQRVPEKWQKKIRLLDNRKEKKGSIPMSHATKIVQMRNIKRDTRNKLFDFVSKNDVSLQNLELVSSIIKTGKDVKSAIKDVEKFKLISVELTLKKREFENIISKFDSNQDFVSSCINKVYPDLAMRKKS